MWNREIVHKAATAGYWAEQSKFSDAVVIPAAADQLSASRVTLQFGRTTPTGTIEDLASFTMHLCIHVGSGVYGRLTDGQKADAEADLDTLMTAQMALMHQSHTLKGYAWHDVDAGDKYYGPVDRLTSKNIAGSAAGTRLPDQVAASVTWRTASRKHWGRVYVPGISHSSLDALYGRPTNGWCDQTASNFRTFANALLSNTAATELVVYSHAHQAILSVDEIHCDNVPDVVRRRRFKQPSYRKAFTA